MGNGTDPPDPHLVNVLGAFALALAVGVHHLAAALVAFAVAVTSNFALNRRWTFAGGNGAVGEQAPRFLAVSVTAALFAATPLDLPVDLLGPCFRGERRPLSRFSSGFRPATDRGGASRVTRLAAGSAAYLVSCRLLGVRELQPLLALRSRFRRG